jgi:hypothetical protein
MIFVVELAPAEAPRCWFAHDEEDLLHKLAAAGALDDWRARWALREQLVAAEVLADDL